MPCPMLAGLMRHGRLNSPSKAALLAAMAGLMVGAASACGPTTPVAETASSPSTASPLPTSSQLRLVVLGDSIASGIDSYGGQGANGWPAIVAQKLGLLSLLSAQPGSGYTRDGSGFAYPARVNDVIAMRPTILIVEGSRNDFDEVATRRVAAEVLGKLHSALPQTKILVIGPLYLDSLDSRTTPVNEAVKAAALSLGLTYIDTLKARWFTGSASRFIGGDGIHPTDEGHRYIANLLVPLVTKLLPAGYVIPNL
jgi:lysophospholipase L1-like esterase